LNTQADAISKFKDINDWKLNSRVFKLLDDTFGPHTIDRFATHNNNLLPRFNSLYWCPGVEAVDAFSQDFSNENNWCNPPFCLIPRLLDLLQLQNAEATIIIPFWWSRPWWPKLCPGGALFAAFVTSVVELPQVDDLFAPGYLAANESSMGKPHWRVLALRVSFKGEWARRARLKVSY
jgi:hypothetical protein